MSLLVKYEHILLAVEQLQSTFYKIKYIQIPNIDTRVNLEKFLYFHNLITVLLILHTLLLELKNIIDKEFKYGKQCGFSILKIDDC